MKRALRSLLALGGMLPALACGAACAGTQVFTDMGQFVAATGASAQPALPQLGLVGRINACATVGDLTFCINGENSDLALLFDEFTSLNPGNEIGESGWEALNVTSASPIYALGSFFVEGTGPGYCVDVICPCANATYDVTLLMGATVVGQFQFNAPDNVLAFVGVWSDQPFDRVEYRDTSFGCDNEFWGGFFVGTTASPPLAVGPSHRSGLLWAASLGCPAARLGVAFRSEEGGTLVFEVFDARGRRVARAERDVTASQSGSFEVAGVQPAGLYHYRLHLASESGGAFEVSGRIVLLR